MENKDKIPDITNLATKAALNTNAREIKSKIPEITTQLLSMQKLQRLKIKDLILPVLLLLLNLTD